MLQRLLSTIALTSALLFSVTTFASLKVGDQAPDFTMKGSDGKTYSLSDYKGKQNVVLAWFPKAFTSGCTIECKSLAENGHLLKEFNAQYFMASTDDASDNERFAQETKADFPLLSDPEGEVADAYDVSFMGYAKRHTFYIDKTGKIVMIDKNVRPAKSAEDMAKYMKMLSFEVVSD
ncbi:peroxiredoxin [Psychrosphaera haliotis]|mgnify:CR=1 FL=1|uniref:thioredoxin-dependent peroxiredoxin n=1 Tax=Psychrosphaera haliotis TaxID=555083 RepID=A0A6N8FA04_9GAMM|nr:peroxiredoxin [Psychrosphaera haliotis]MDA8622139.1 peroxiredoxin [Psychrosphaera sp.]MUH71622.1 redoxin domain-containing protein [Psychrosphaera haliotis]